MMNKIMDPDRPVFTGRVLRRLLIVVATLGTLVTTGALIAGALVPEQPRLDTPIALNGEVWAVEQVGNAVVVGGNFTQVQTVRNGPVINQAGIYAYDIDSGILLDDFLPTLMVNNGTPEIKAIQPAADGRSIYIGGKFTQIDDHTDNRVRTRNRIAKIDVTTGRLDRNFARGGVDAKVLTLELVGNDLYVGGNYNRIYDTDVGRPPLEHEQSSFARFDATSGAYDATFRIVPDVSIARTGMLGVTNIAATPNGQYLVFSHRGQDLVDLNGGQRFERPGIAMLDLNAGASVTGFKALMPGGNNAYSRASCGSRGIFIRDLEVSPDGSYFAVTHQGHDTGWVCDTAIRWNISTTPSEPAWVSRIFDSVFSIGIADDAIYVGGHFRYMVHPDAPSSFPGRQPNANGQVSPYNAGSTQGPFGVDLVRPGYVYRAYQMGAIDPATGRGIPEWNPGSDAYKCVCAITVIDRGLLIGQDRGRVAGFNVGRSGFFDETPDAGNPRCVVALDENNNPVVSWTDIGNVTEWRVARNGDFQAGTAATSWTDPNPPFDTDLSYELRFNRNGLSQTDDCGTVRVNLVPLTCVVEVRSDTSLEVDWNNNEADRYTVRRNDTFVAEVEDRTRYEDSGLAPGTTYDYEIRSVRNGVTQSTTCSGTTPGRALTCSVAVVGEDITISFNGGDFSRVSIQRDGAWQATLSEGETTFLQTLEPGTYVYTATGVVDGFSNTADCGTAEVEARAVVCSVAAVGEDVTVSFNGAELDRATVQRDGDWQATLTDGEISFDQTVAPGTYTYSVTGTVNGLQNTAECGRITIGARAVACSVAAVEEQVTVSFNGADFGRVTIQRDGEWQTTLTDGEVDFAQTVDAGTYGYSVTGVFNGLSDTADCGTVTVDPPVLACTATIEGNDVLVTWNDVGAASYQARRNGSWAATLDPGTITWTDAAAAAAGNTYEVRYRLDGVLNTISCA